jgi:crotonobetainyl-CoA:carnitine CoA-transferase CaiB-like acyl-CoA transferase
MRVTSEHPFEPALSLVRNPLTFLGTPVTEYRAPPLLGSDTDEILSTIGYDGERIDTLRKKGVV